MLRPVVSLVLLTFPLAAQRPADELFEKSIRPLFAARCYSCHGEKVQMGGLQLSSSAGLRKAAETGVISPGNPDKSRLLNVLAWSEAVRMPPTGKLEDAQLAGVKEWITSGAAFPESSPAVVSRNTIKPPHWAFLPVKQTEPPAVRQRSWVKSPIDAFILSGLEAKNLQPAPPANKLALLRRVTYDLIGLPPAESDIAAFLADGSPDAFAKVVDRLLASPAYGERWGRHWLDVARYADSTGMDEDNLYPHAWRYRDYVVNAFNDDLRWDRFITEQIAGDLLPAADAGAYARQMVATGFLAIGPRPLAQQDRVQMRYDVVDEQIDTVSKAFLGLTVACARCHDHKFDPIPTKDYYGLASIFASTVSFRNQGRPGAISYMHYEPLDPAAFSKYQAHRLRMLGKQMEMEDALSEDSGRENAAVRPKVGAFLTAAWYVEHAGDTPDTAARRAGVSERELSRWLGWLRGTDEKARSTYLRKWSEATRETVEAVAAAYQEAYTNSASKWDGQLERWRSRFSKEALQDRDLPERPKFDAEQDPFFAAATFNGGPMDLPESERVQYLRSEWKALEAALPEAPAMASAVRDGAIVEQHVFLRGDHHSPGDIVDKHVPGVIAGSDPPQVKTGSGRLELARWLTNPGNPLTARVIVNRVWQWHFGEGLMRTPNNWGTTGERPTHPELLDYLASRFVQDGWSMKSLHRLIVLSNTYQMSSRIPPEVREADPGNRLWSRFNRLRMSVEQIRDSLLALDGSLDSKTGGTLLPADKGKRPKIEFDDLKRRTIYLPVRRGSIPTLLATFDFGDATTSNDGRPRTNVAPQALFLMNSRFVIERSRGLVAKVLDASPASDPERVSRAYRAVLTRSPEPAEIDSALTYIGGLQHRLGGSDARERAWASFCHILISTNEFLYIE